MTGSCPSAPTWRTTCAATPSTRTWSSTADRGAGACPAGTRLPSVRALAGDLGIAPNTVVRAYRELEAAGVVRTARGRGTVVADAPPAPDDAAVGAAVERAVALARAAGWDAARLRRAVDDAQRVRSDR
ncbi:GntR family transcriptional regulator [Micrococcus luteus]